MSFESLKTKIANNQECVPPDLYLFFEDSTTIENLVPEMLFRPKMKGYTKKAARILWLRELTNRDVFSSKELWGKELWYIHEWLTGLAGSTDDRELNQVLNWQEFSEWCMQKANEIMGFAYVVKQIELAKAEMKRQVMKAQTEGIPF